jgi:hypothetical protein
MASSHRMGCLPGHHLLGLLGLTHRLAGQLRQGYVARRKPVYGAGLAWGWRGNFAKAMSPGESQSMGQAGLGQLGLAPCNGFRPSYGLPSGSARPHAMASSHRMGCLPGRHLLGLLGLLGLTHRLAGQLRQGYVARRKPVYGAGWAWSARLGPMQWLPAIVWVAFRVCSAPCNGFKPSYGLPSGPPPAGSAGSARLNP